MYIAPYNERNARDRNGNPFIVVVVVFLFLRVHIFNGLFVCDAAIRIIYTRNAYRGTRYFSTPKWPEHSRVVFK